ncbi:hypothetical protein BCV70DRAFT_65146 [Testicularia cyperi]|uniref:Uncharacterized protein n=1 Tax=Testicularia cyperi TaxID=1882483 RepID=A0A317XGR6_9BASI|nr:hypothetical protein BCV70DRAFT_65146 [Testicularia cyperi]
MPTGLQNRWQRMLCVARERQKDRERVLGAEMEEGVQFRNEVREEGRKGGWKRECVAKEARNERCERGESWLRSQLKRCGIEHDCQAKEVGSRWRIDVYEDGIASVWCGPSKLECRGGPRLGADASLRLAAEGQQNTMLFSSSVAQYSTW